VQKENDPYEGKTTLMLNGTEEHFPEMMPVGEELELHRLWIEGTERYRKDNIAQINKLIEERKQKLSPER
jgi:hypothetical protein